MASTLTRTLILVLAVGWGSVPAADVPSVAAEPIAPIPAALESPLIKALPPRAGQSLDLTIQPAAPALPVEAPAAPPADALPPPGARDSAAAAESISGPGSAALLDACWTPEQLKGRPGERKIRQQRPADHSPPERLTPTHPDRALGPAFARSLRSVAPFNGEPLVALTFDLCEQASDVTGYDGALVDLLRAEKVKATFYAGGKWMRSHPERTLQLMADPLFELGNHAWTHGNLRVLGGRELEEQIQWTQAEYELLREDLLARPCAHPFAAEAHDSIPVLPRTLRFPYGTCSAAALDAVAAAGLYPVQWSIVTGDPAAGQSAAQIVKGVLASLKPGAIVIAHGNGRGWHTAEALTTLIPAIRKRGYRFVTVSELIAAGTPHLVDECYEVKPGDNRRYDKLFGKGTE
jgi:peptidoglycan/xylan/chitin deacetylase (PgdA/CDA1 family)